MTPERSSGAPWALKTPSPGDELFHFRICRELGRGAFARVFLAEQADLACRQVVLKCSTIEGSEPQTLAQLQHTNIVPIYSVHEDTEAGLRVVCMPYFGGASLAQVLELLWTRTIRPLRGEDLVWALGLTQGKEQDAKPEPGAAAGTPAQPGGAPGSTPLHLLQNLSYVQAAAWIISRLADGLHHAHQRGVVHHDIKPSNILLGADGQPMLLDFNLAQKLLDPQTQVQAVLGGTVAYMAPEHLRALTSRDPELHRQVDHRADIYSLGIVLFEMLTGHSPFTHKGSYSVLPVLIELMAMERLRTVPSARQKRPDVPWGLESILRKCLRPDKAQRYQQAGQLAGDLRRFLENQPLRHAPELSRVEAVQKWCRRRPRLTSAIAVAAVAATLLTGVAFSLAGIRQHLSATRKQLEVTEARERKRVFTEKAQRALCLVNTTAEGCDHLLQGKEACQDALSLYDVLKLDDWQEQPAWQLLDHEERQRLGEDARELLLLLAWTETRVSAPDKAREGAVPQPDPAALRRALELLERAEGIADLPSSRALWEDRALYLGRLGDHNGARSAREKAAGVEAASVRDRYLLATSFARRGRHGEAIAELDQALQQNPRHYWSVFQRGVCFQELGKFAQACGDFGTCIGLWPEFALGYFNRGYCLDKTGNKEEAIRDYSAALQRDPDLVPAYMNRSMACLERKQYSQALADFQKVSDAGKEDAFLHAGRGVALEGLGKFREAEASFRKTFACAEKTPEAIDNRIRWVYGFAVCSRLPNEALAAFETVLARDPDHPQALYGRAMLLAERGRLTEATAHLDRAVEVSPGFLEARRCRAVLQARRGNLDAASQEINALQLLAPENGSILYGAACVASWTAQKSTNPVTSKSATKQALALLQKAVARGYGRDKVAQDPDLAAVREHPDFQRLVAKP